MSRRYLLILAMAALTLLVTVSAPAFPRQEPPATPPSAEDGTEAPKPQSEAAVEQILREQEKMLTGHRFSYDPDGRRDPFRNLAEAMQIKGKRPRGAAGMLVAEMDLVGIVKGQDGMDVGLLIGSDAKGYFLKVGDTVFDGTIIAVDSRLGTVTFRQKVDDPRQIKPYRDVTKTLVTEDEEISQ